MSKSTAVEVERAERVVTGGRPVRVALVAADSAFESLVATVVEGQRDLALDTFADAEVAQRAIARATEPVIVLIDGARLGATALPPHAHVIALVGSAHDDLLPERADEILRRPLRSDDLATRLRLAARRVARERRTDPRTLLLAALAAGTSGELVVAADGDTARIHVVAGRIAWIHRPRHRPSLRDILDLAPSAVDDVTVRAIVERSYASRRHFADVAIDMGVRSRSAVRACLVRHLGRELAAVLGWAEASATFVEERRTSGASFDFDVTELMNVRASSTRLDLDLTELAPEPASPANDRGAESGVDALLDRVATIPQLTGYSVLDVRLGIEVASKGALRGQGDVAWSLACGLEALGKGAEEMFASRHGAAFLARCAGPSKVLVVAFDPEVTVPGMARLLMADAMKA